MGRKFSIIKTLDLDKLNNEIYEYACFTNERYPYIFMSDDTAKAIADMTNPFDMFYTKESLKSKDDVRAEYNGCKVFTNNDLKFGIVEIR